MKIYLILGVAALILVFSALMYVDKASQQEYQVDRLQKEVDTYQRVEEAVNDSRQTNPYGDPNTALNELRQRLGSP